MIVHFDSWLFKNLYAWGYIMFSMETWYGSRGRYKLLYIMDFGRFIIYKSKNNSANEAVMKLLEKNGFRWKTGVALSEWDSKSTMLLNEVFLGDDTKTLMLTVDLSSGYPMFKNRTKYTAEEFLAKFGKKALEDMEENDEVVLENGEDPSIVLRVTGKGFLHVEEEEGATPIFTTFEEARKEKWKIKQPWREEEKEVKEQEESDQAEELSDDVTIMDVERVMGFLQKLTQVTKEFEGKK